MDKAGKTTVIQDLKEQFSRAHAAFFADYKGLTVEQMTVLRKGLRAHNAKVRVIKNNLARKAAESLSEDQKKLMDTVAGPTLVAFAYGDPAAAAKVIQKFVEDNEVFGLKQSLLNAKILSTKEVEELAKLPSREVLLAKVLGAMNAPITNFVSVLAAVPRNFVQVLAAIEEKKKKQ